MINIFTLIITTFVLNYMSLIDPVKSNSNNTEFLLNLSKKSQQEIREWRCKNELQCIAQCFYGSYDLNNHILALIKVNDNIIASTSKRGHINLWSIPTGQYLKTLSDERYSILIRIDDDTIASGSYDGTIKIWSVSTGQCLRVLKLNDSKITALTEINNDTIASGSHDGKINFWSISTGQCLKTLELSSKITALVKVNDDTIVSSNDDKTIKIWSISTGQCLKTLEFDIKITALIKFDDDTIACARMYNNFGRYYYWNGIIDLWSVSTGKKIKSLKGGIAYTNCLIKFNDDIIVSGDAMNFINFWPTCITNNYPNDLLIKSEVCNSEIKSLLRISNKINETTCLLKINDDTIASGSQDGGIRFWQIKPL